MFRPLLLSKHVLLLACTLLPACGDASQARAEAGTMKTQTLFARPLITGASVSANWGTTSPGRRASLRFTNEANIRTIAQGGNPGVNTVDSLEHDQLKDRSLIIAMDLFFWDSTLSAPQQSLAALRSFLRTTQELNIPVLLGDIPPLLPGRQPYREVLNAEIHSKCKSARHCKVWQLDKIHSLLQKQGYLEIDGRKYTERELIPDGLHLSPVASEFLAGELVAVLRM